VEKRAVTEKVVDSPGLGTEKLHWLLLGMFYKERSILREDNNGKTVLQRILTDKMTSTNRKAPSEDGDAKATLEALEEVSDADRLLALFPILQNKTPEELEKLNKAVLRKLDWWFLPCVTMMLLMRCVDALFIRSTC
jgi:hypothetical protein